MTATECKDQIRAAHEKVHPGGRDCNNGYNVSCSLCHAAELPILREYAKDKPVIQIDIEKGKERNDAFYHYWERIDGPYYDEWVTVAQEKVRAFMNQ